jgi:hypothetical protein
MNGYNTNEEVKRLKPEGHLRSKAQQVIHGLHGKKSPKNPVVIIAEKVVEGIKKVVDEVSSLIPGDSSQQEVKMSALEQFRQLQAARKAAAEGKEKAAKEALVHSQIVGLQKPVTVEEGGRIAGRELPQAVRNKLRATQASGSSAVPKRSVSPPKWTMLPTAANEKRAKAVRNYLMPRSRSSSPQSNEEAEGAPGSEENVSNNQKGMASQNKPANAVAAGNAAANAAAAAGASPAVVNATASAVANAVANAPPGQEGQVAAAAAEEAVVAAGGNVGQAAAASEAASANAGGNANAEADRIEQEAAAQQAALAAQASGAPPAAVEAAANAVASGASPAVVEAAVVNAGGSPAAAANASAVASNAGAANRLAALSPVLPPSNGGSPGAGVVANAPAILGAASAAATNSLVVPGSATSPLPVDSAPCPPVGLAPGTYAATVQRTMTGETAVTFKSTGPQGKGTSWSMPGFSFGSGKGKTVEQQVKEQPKAWTWKGINFGESLKGLKGFVIDLTPLLMALQAVGTVAGGAIGSAVGAPMFGAYIIGQGFVLVGLAMAGAFQALAGLDFKKIYPGITLANLFGLGTDPRMKKLAKAISEYQTLNKQGIQQVVNAAKQARSSRFSNNAAVQNRVEAEIKTVKRLLAGKQGDIKLAAKGIAKEIADDLFNKLSKEQQDSVDTQLAPIQPAEATPYVSTGLNSNRKYSTEINEIKDDFSELNVLVEKMYLSAAALGNVPEAQYPMAKAEAIRTAYAQFLKDVQVLDELQQLAQGSNAKASVNKMWNKTQKYRSNAASYGRAAQQGLSGFGSRIGSMFTRKTNASKPNSSGYVPGAIGSNRYTNANRNAQQVALAQAAAPKKGFFGRLGNSLKSVFKRKTPSPLSSTPPAAAPANGQNNGSFNKVNPMRNAFTSPQAAAAGASGERLYVQPRASAPQAPSRGFFGRVRNTLGVPRGLTLKKGKEGNYSGFGRNEAEVENAGESQNPFGLTQGAGNAYEALNRANAEGKRRKRKTQKRKDGRR